MAVTVSVTRPVILLYVQHHHPTSDSVSSDHAEDNHNLMVLMQCGMVVAAAAVGRSLLWMWAAERAMHHEWKALQPGPACTRLGVALHSLIPTKNRLGVAQLSTAIDVTTAIRIAESVDLHHISKDLAPFLLTIVFLFLTKNQKIALTMSVVQLCSKPSFGSL